MSKQDIYAVNRYSLLYNLLGVLFLSIVFLTSCDQDFEELTDEASKADKRGNHGGVLMDMSFDIKTSQDFEITSSKLSSLDLASMNTKSEKQHIQMQLFENGQMNLIIEELNFEIKIKIHHKTLPDDSP